LRLAFVGTNYTGWQHQKNGLSVQEVIETAIGKITGEEITLVGCSRTDAGVHAEDYVANFRTVSSIPADKFKPAIQSKLPRDIQILKSGEVSATFDARRSSFEKTYRYQIYFGYSPFCLDRWWQFGGDMDLRTLTGLAEVIVGTHDFSGFCVRKSLKTDNTCTIKDAAWRRSGKRLYFKITGDRFLHHMVRFLVERKRK